MNRATYLSIRAQLRQAWHGLTSTVDSAIRVEREQGLRQAIVCLCTAARLYEGRSVPGQIVVEDLEELRIWIPHGKHERELEVIEHWFTRGRKVAKDTEIHMPDLHELMSIALPVLWVALENGMNELELRKPLSARLVTWGKGLLALAALALAAALVFKPAHVRDLVTGAGCRVTYYQGLDFDNPAGSQAERELSKDYETNAPMAGVGADGWSARWQGVLHVPETADYGFTTQQDDGLRLYIDDELLIKNWRDQVWEDSVLRTRCRLTKGKHRIVVEHYDRSGPASVRVKWVGGPISKLTVLGPPYLTRR